MVRIQGNVQSCSTALESTKCYLIFFEQHVALFFLFILAKADVLGCGNSNLCL